MQQTFAAQSCPAFYADNEPKSALARDLGDCRDNKGKHAKHVFTCYFGQFRKMKPYLQISPILKKKILISVLKHAKMWYNIKVYFQIGEQMVAFGGGNFLN